MLWHHIIILTSFYYHQQLFYDCFKTDHNHNENMFSLTNVFPHYFVLFPSLYIKISFRQMGSSLALQLTDIKQCPPLQNVVFFLVLFHYSHIMKAASVTQSSVVCKHWCHIRTSHSVYSHDEKPMSICLNLLTPGVWYCNEAGWRDAQRDRVTEWEEGQETREEETEQGRTREVNT